MKLIPLTPVRPDWMDGAPCSQIDPELWHAAAGDQQTTRTAQKICRTCPHRWPCLQYAMDTAQTWGVWGATTPRERAAMRREAAA